MKKFLMIGCAFLLILAFTGSSQAFIIDFEDGTDGASVNNITGVSFGNALYGDSRAVKTTGPKAGDPKYNTYSDDLGIGWGSELWHHNGNLWAYAATTSGITVDFTNNDYNWFTTGYASADTFYLDAYLTDGSMVQVLGAGTGPMGSLAIDVASSGYFIDYIVLHTASIGIVDDMSGGVAVPEVTTLSVPTNGVPEPATMLLLGSGLIGLLGFRRKFRKA